MNILTGVLIFTIFVLAAALWKYERQVKDICRQLAFIKEHESNMLISREFEAGGIGLLADTMNDFISIARKEKKSHMEKEKMIADLYTNLSHDIRTPLTSLDGYFQLLESGCSEEEQKRYIEISKERIDSLKEMLEELFTYTKLKNEAYQVALSKCCVNRILKETVFSYYEDWRRLQIEPEIEIAKELLYIDGNPQALRRVIQNIIKNALDHGNRRLKITLCKEGNVALLTVSNEVTEPEKIDTSKVFERFYKADEARNRNSTGLGLSIAREFVLRMNGEIKARVIGNEFCVEIALPLKENNIS